MKITATQTAYLAGIIDGEGFIGISRKREPTQRSGYSYRVCISVSNTKLKLLEWIHRITGVGSICSMKRKPKHKPAWVWQTWSQRARVVLEKVLPYLLIKKAQALLAIRFALTHGINNRKGKNGLTPKQWSHQQRIHAKLAILNKRGTA